jgi:predicted nucleic acid-binding protein
MIFIDTSALVKPYLREPGEHTVRTVLKKGAREIFISNHVALEVAATFAYKLRAGTVDRRTYHRIRGEFFTDLPQVFQVVDVDEGTVQRAIDLADNYRVQGVGSIDLIHVATAERLGVAKRRMPTIVCADRAMRNLASAAGFSVFNPETDDPITLAAN